MSWVPNCHIIIIVNSPGRSSIKFYTGKLSPESNYLQKRYSLRVPFHSSLMVEGSSGLLQAFYPQGVLNKVLYGEALPRGPYPYLSTYMFDRKGTPFIYRSIPFGCWGVGWLVTGIISPGGTQQSFTRKPCPEVHVLTFPHTIFDRKGTPFVYHSIPFGGCRVGWLVTGILKWSQTIQGSMGRKTALSKSNLRAILQFLFFSNKIVLTLRNM